MGNYEIRRDGTRREIKGIELFSIEHPVIAQCATFALAMFVIVSAIILFA